MKHCPITYDLIESNQTYSQRGLRKLSPKLKALHSLTLSANEQTQEALARAGKMSIQGVQTKLSATLKIKQGCFDIVDTKGTYILKPPSKLYDELPENEAISMTLAETIGLEVPVHGLILSKDDSMTYFIKRFDRAGHNKKLAQEDFAQLSGFDRHTKYNSSMEHVITLINKFCTFPKIEGVKFFKLTLFNFLIGNEDMHLKNFSLLTTGNKIALSPAYDLLNSSIVLKQVKEEIALPIRGKKNNLTQKDFIHYLAKDRLGLNSNVIEGIMGHFQKAIPTWVDLISVSFLSPSMKLRYLTLLEERCRRFDFILPNKIA